MLARADQALRQHRFAVALSAYEELRANSPDHGPLIEYRYALCQEAIGQVNKAIAGYRTAIGGAHAPALSFVCHLGLARCLFRQGQFAEARRPLYPFLFDESRQRDLPRAFVADARYLLALSLSREAMEPRTAKTDHEAPITVSGVGLEIPYYLDELAAPPAGGGLARTGDVTQKTADAQPGTGTKTADTQPAVVKKKADVVVQKKADGKAAVVSKVDVNGPAAEVLELLSVESAISIEPSTDAEKALAERSLRLCLQNWQLDDLLENIADHFDLTCRVKGTTREFCTRSEIDAKELMMLQRNRAIGRCATFC